MMKDNDLKAKLLDILKQWETEQISEEEVQELAEELAEPYDSWPIYPKNEEASISLEVLSQLDSFQGQRIIKDDIPVFIEFLTATPNDIELAWKKWEHYWSTINFDNRK